MIGTRASSRRPRDETCFPGEGPLRGLLAWSVVGSSRSGRRALAAAAGSTCVGLASALGVVGRAIVR